MIIVKIMKNLLRLWYGIKTMAKTSFYDVYH